MNTPSPKRKCHLCGLRYDQHANDKCADGKTFYATVRVAASQSFNGDEVNALKRLCAYALKDPNQRVFVQSEAFRNLYRKALAMEKRYDFVKKMHGATSQGQE